MLELICEPPFVPPIGRRRVLDSDQLVTHLWRQKASSPDSLVTNTVHEYDSGSTYSCSHLTESCTNYQTTIHVILNGS